MRVFMLVFALAGSAFGQTSGVGMQTTAADFAFMRGCWELSKPNIKAKISEQWMAPEGDTLIGMSRYVRDGKTSDFEFMRIEVRDVGIYFISKPRGNATETTFRLRHFNTGDATFENLEHDFPQRVIYRSGGPNALNARIEGTQNGKSSGIDFPYKRVKCD